MNKIMVFYYDEQTAEQDHIRIDTEKQLSLNDQFFFKRDKKVCLGRIIKVVHDLIGNGPTQYYAEEIQTD